MSTKKPAAATKPAATAKDLKPKQNPKGGTGKNIGRATLHVRKAGQIDEN